MRRLGHCDHGWDYILEYYVMAYDMVTKYYSYSKTCFCNRCVFHRQCHLGRSSRKISGDNRPPWERLDMNDPYDKALYKVAIEQAIERKIIHL
jgi:hypothetical protein